MAVRILPSADIDPGVEIGDESSVWHLAQIRSGARLGRDVVVGRGAYLGTGVQVGDGCKKIGRDSCRQRVKYAV